MTLIELIEKKQVRNLKKTIKLDDNKERVVEKNSISDSSEFHSRTASDSSTGKSYTTTALIDNHNNFEDPYAKSHYKNKKRLSLSANERANSYLPYSHHERDVNQNVEPIYIEDTTTTPATTSLGIGSILNENLLFSNDSKKPQHSSNIPNHQNLTSDLPIMNTLRRKKQVKTYFGLRLRTILFIVFIWVVIIVIIWYFVWPRIPTLTLQDINNNGTTQVITNTTKKIMSTDWTINMTADNSNNWVPTRFDSIDLTIIDYNTNVQFGNGSLTHFTLPARKQSNLIIPITIYYATEDRNDTTFQDLYNACGILLSSTNPYDNQQDVLNVTFSVTYHISGIVWSTTKYVPYTGVTCPVN